MSHSNSIHAVKHMFKGPPLPDSYTFNSYISTKARFSNKKKFYVAVGVVTQAQSNSKHLFQPNCCHQIIT